MSSTQGLQESEQAKLAKIQESYLQEKLSLESDLNAAKLVELQEVREEMDRKMQERVSAEKKADLKKSKLACALQEMLRRSV